MNRTRRLALATACLGLSTLSACAAPVTSEVADTVDVIADDTPAATADLVALGAAALTAAGSIELDFLLDRIAVLAADDLAGRDNGSPGGLAARAWLQADLANQGLPPMFAGDFVQTFTEGANLCAVLQGSDPALRHELVLLGAHYDHLGSADDPGSQCIAPVGAADRICNGAIDNAAGVAVAIAVLRAHAQAPLRPRRSLGVCLFDAEEDGLLGSKHFVAAASAAPADSEGVWPLAAITAMFSVDNVGSQIVPGETSSFATDAEFSDALRAAVHAANASAVAGDFVTWPVSSFFVGQDGGGRSDHLPFREAGVPVLFLGSGSSSVYHTTADEPDALDTTKLLAIARHTAVLVAAVANADERPDLHTTGTPHLDDARAMVSIADRVLANPAALGLADAQIALVQSWRSDLQGWLDTPPQTATEWESYQNLVRAIVKAVFVFAGA